MNSLLDLRIDIARDHVFGSTWGYRINDYTTKLLVTGTNHHVWADNYETPDDAMADAIKALKAVAAELDARPKPTVPCCPQCGRPGADGFDEFSPALPQADAPDLNDWPHDLSKFSKDLL
jgi:hypothetical protein